MDLSKCTYSLFSDGGSRGNPGNAGAGFVLLDASGNEISAGKKYLGRATNNIAEYTALILGLQKAQEMGIFSLNCFLDSELIVRQLSGQYRVKHPDLKPLFLEVQKRAYFFKSISFLHVPRAQNKRADQLANEAMDEAE
ncbi:ribonuclease HI family protein [Candidatus Peregrinibacteria bacterium]|nr:MAG: ribonuclease HI family protein [Candidatus Peregrinibacteria bacterium]